MIRESIGHRCTECACRDRRQGMRYRAEFGHEGRKSRDDGATRVGRGGRLELR